MARRKSKGLCGTGMCWESIQLQVDAGNNHLRHPGRVPTQCEYFLEAAGTSFDAANRNIESQECDRAVLNTIHGWTNIARLSDCQAAARGIKGLGKGVPRRGLQKFLPERSMTWSASHAEEACAEHEPGPVRDECMDYFLMMQDPSIRAAMKHRRDRSMYDPIEMRTTQRRSRYGRMRRRGR